ncbi:MAG: GTPase Obg [Phycisphaerae bacterium]|nr:GTPase Obg [Phycisphaerae bacterium]
MFIDEADILVQSGAGGPGCVSFRREKYLPKGGPDGGDGGLGGSVILSVDPQMNTLMLFAGKSVWIADNGRPGEGSNRAGRDAEDLIIPVPPGTLIYDREHGLLIKELLEPNEQVILLPGGRGGRGNAYFVSPTHQTPRHSQRGEPGQQRLLHLELKLIADVGLVGLPNAGKSTLLSRTTKAKPKIADYPFTTLAPQLGIVYLSNLRSFTLADIPGLIAGAHEGVGLGDAFLRHIERTRLIIHLVDIAPLEGLPQPLEAYQTIRTELRKYSPNLADKPEIIVANKMDLTAADEQLEQLRQQLSTPVIPISAVTGQGLDTLVEYVWSQLQLTASNPQITTPPHASETL